jgi:hypothetical protein
MNNKGKKRAGSQYSTGLKCKEREQHDDWGFRRAVPHSQGVQPPPLLIASRESLGNKHSNFALFLSSNLQLVTDTTRNQEAVEVTDTTHIVQPPVAKAGQK